MRSIAFLILALAAQARAEFKPGLMADLRGRYESQPSTNNSGFGQSSDILFVPAFAWGKHSVLPVLAFLQAGRGAESAGDGSPELLFVQRNTFLAKPLYKFQWSDGLALKGWGVAKRAVNFEKVDVAWSLGKYDWEEFGAGFGADMKLGGWASKLGGSLEVHHRTYMNWREARPDLTRNKNYYTKDYNGLKAGLSLDGPEKSALPWSASLTWLGKAHTDNFVQKAASQVTDLDYDLPRFDQLLRLGGDLGYGLGGGYSLALDVSVDWNLSNQNLLDTVYVQPVPDFYGYLAVGGGLKLAWGPASVPGAYVAVRAGLNNRAYSGRLIRNPDKSYTQGKQADLEQLYSLDLAWPLPVKGLSVVGGASQLWVSTNQAYANQAPTSYDLFSTTLGLQYKL